MGEEKKDKAASNGDKKTKDAAAPPPPPAAEQQPIVLKVDLHCAGCASKVKRAIRHAPGVESVKTDTAANKVVVTGAAADAADLKERIEARAKKPVHIVSAGAGAGPAKKDDKESGKPEKQKADGGGEKDKKPEKEKGSKPEKAEKGNKTEKKAEKKPKDNKEEKKPKEAKEETVTLKIRLHCDGCIDRIRRRVYKIKGVKDVAVDAGKDLVKVTGTMDAAALPGYLRDKLSRPVEVVAPAKKADGEKSKKEGGGGGDDKKDKSVAPMPMADPSMYQMPPQYHGYHVPYNAAPGGYYGAAAAAPPPNPAFYPAAYYPPPPPPPYASYPAHAPQMFSDENPNACSVM
uniref:Uncharacterized protein n=1 Tax=Avena sativa TaxID=4498 RepID=A0ACD5TXH3_AVESA